MPTPNPQTSKHGKVDEGSAKALSAKRPREESPGFLESVGTEMVDLFVGPEKRHFRVHKTILCEKIPYFDKMFNGGFIEAKELEASFPDDLPQAFDIVVEWVYVGKLRHLSSKATPNFSSWNAFDVYMLADKLCLDVLKDAVIDLYREWLPKQSAPDYLPRTVECYKKIPAGAPFRRFICDDLHYIIVQERDSKHISVDFVKCTQSLMTGNEDFFFDLLKRFMMRPDSWRLEDPRTRPSCEYHHHEKDAPCARKTDR
ncbi:hypothetical protein ACMFMG_011081 [Clarireedia jacksonii]